MKNQSLATICISIALLFFIGMIMLMFQRGDLVEADIPMLVIIISGAITLSPVMWFFIWGGITDWKWEN